MIILNKPDDCSITHASSTYTITQRSQFRVVGSCSVTLWFGGTLLTTLTASNPTYTTDVVGEYTVRASGCGATEVHADDAPLSTTGGGGGTTTTVSPYALHYVEDDRSRTVTGTNIILTAVDGQISFTLNGGGQVNLSSEGAYRTEEMEGVVEITADGAFGDPPHSSVYHVSWRD